MIMIDEDNGHVDDGHDNDGNDDDDDNASPL